MKLICGVGVVCAVMVLGGCPRVATCSSDAECESGYRCDTAAGTCQPGSPSATSSGGSSGASSGMVSSSSMPPPDAGVDCPGRCGSLADGGNVLTWTCEGGTELSNCRVASCAGAFANCDDGGVTCEVDTDTDEANCGACGSPLDTSRGTSCVDGAPDCDGTTCASSQTCVAPATDGGIHACCTSSQTNCGGSCVDTQSTPEHCGACGNDITSSTAANGCAGGMPQCGSGPACTGGTPFCVGQGIEASCVACRDDADCSGGTPVCCGGACTATADACGCDVVPGGTAGEACMASGTGGLCVGDDGSGAVALDSNSAPGLFHQAACGCVPNGGMVVTDMAECAPGNTLLGLCAPPSGTGPAGTCIAQNNPPRMDTQGAGNCGAVGVTCTPTNGGLRCLSAAGSGVGLCACDSNNPTGPQDGCLVPMAGGGRDHVVASGCLSKMFTGGAVDTCRCGLSEPCDPSSASPDCCGTGCTDVTTDEANCGVCGALCGLNTTDACGTAPLPPGQCACENDTQCPLNGGGGGETCVSGACVCSTFRQGSMPGTANYRACAMGMFCCAGQPRPSGGSDFGCCERACGTDGNRCTIQPGVAPN